MKSLGLSRFALAMGAATALFIFAVPLNDEAAAKSGTLIGKMSWWQQIVGSWACEVTIEPMEGEPARKWITILKGSVVPGNVFHLTESAPGLQTDQYNGYANAKKGWWEAEADSFGYATLLQSSDNRLYVQISVPPSFEQDRSKYRETYKLGPDGVFHTTTERQIHGAWVRYDESSCKRMQSEPPA